MATNLPDALREELRFKHYSYRTEQAYVDRARGDCLSHASLHHISLAASVAGGTGGTGATLAMTEFGKHSSPFSGTHLLQAGYDIRAVQELLEHKDLRIMIYIHVLERGGLAVRSLLDLP